MFYFKQKGSPCGLLEAENITSARCSRVVLSKLLAARKANFLFLLVLAKKSQCSACSRMLAKTIRHPQLTLFCNESSSYSNRASCPHNQFLPVFVPG